MADLRFATVSLSTGPRLHYAEHGTRKASPSFFSQAMLASLPDPIPVEFGRDFQASTAYSPLPAPFFDRIVEKSMKLPARLWRATFEGLLAYSDEHELPRISTPTLLLWGEYDALFPRQHQDRVAAAIPGSRLTVYQEIGHCPNWECPDRVAADLQAFLQRG